MNFQILPPKLDVDAGLKGHARLEAALNRENAARVGRERTVLLSAKATAGQNLTGRARAEAACNRENIVRLHAAPAPNVVRLAAIELNPHIAIDADSAANAASRPGQPVVTGASLPSTLTIVPWGETSGLTVGAETLAKLAANQARFGLDTVPIILGNQPADEDDIAGTGTPAVIEGTGIVLQNIKWADDKASSVLQFSSLQPTVWRDTDNNIVLLLSVALMSSYSSGISSQPVPSFITNLSATEAAARLGITAPVLRGLARMESGFAAENRRAGRS